MTLDQRPSVELLTGFLGAGKTTLLNALLQHPAWSETAVVVNEIGAVGLDHLLVSEQRPTDNVALLQGGCLCCTVVNSLPETLLDLCRRAAAGEIPGFRRIVIETTGLAEPGSIVNLIRHSSLIAHFLRPASVITVVDSEAGDTWLDHYPEADAQVALADWLVLTKLDLVGDNAAALRRRLAVINPLAEQIDAGTVATAPERLLLPIHRPVVEGMARVIGHSHGLAARHIELSGVASRASLTAWSHAIVERLGKRLIRCKGVVAGRAGHREIRLLVQGVGARFTFDATSLPVTGLTVIGRDLTAAELAADLSLIGDAALFDE